MTIFEAEVELTADGVMVEILGIDPSDADPVAIASAKEAIRRGAEQVLMPKGKGAIIRVQRIVIHPVDFKPSQFERYTVEELGRLLDE